MLISLKCPHCHGDVQLDDSREFGFCMYCGTKIINEKNERTVIIDEKNKVVNLLKNAKYELELGHNSAALKLINEALLLDADCKDALIVKAKHATTSKESQVFRRLAEKGNPYGIIDETDVKPPRKITIYADPSLKDSLQISIEGTQFTVTIEPGEYVRLPSVGGQRKVLLHYRGVATAMNVNMCIVGAIQILPPAGVLSGGFVRYKNYTKPLPEC